MTDTKITAVQKENLISFMEDHSDFAEGKLLGVDGRKVRAALWEILATQLNSCDGPKKSTTKWQRVWIDLKNKV
ncbi:hypothetical protein RN001_005621 [Aquatica leii]|uniref:Regulatory protein zeste n=1 Tax=Aquatica leii TaxID=1421715 RepID=A0AAN7SHX7_9COLE|nr:hypothetical protein RN001_005621 [Aquatica leii]